MVVGEPPARVCFRHRKKIPAIFDGAEYESIRLTLARLCVAGGTTWELCKFPAVFQGHHRRSLIIIPRQERAQSLCEPILAKQNFIRHVSEVKAAFSRGVFFELRHFPPSDGCFPPSGMVRYLF